jgi:hypothetical protein
MIKLRFTTFSFIFSLLFCANMPMAAQAQQNQNAQPPNITMSGASTFIGSKCWAAAGNATFKVHKRFTPPSRMYWTSRDYPQVPSIRTYWVLEGDFWVWQQYITDSTTSLWFEGQFRYRENSKTWETDGIQKFISLKRVCNK